MDTIPLTIALAAGALAVLNPCGFPLLPALLSFYVGADDGALPRTPNRVLQGAAVGVAVASGFLGLFAVMSLPIVYGARAVADAVPWVGVALGVGLAATGVAVLSGRRIGLTVLRIRKVRERRRGLAAAAAFGAVYGVASLGCTLPIFLALLGASIGVRGLSVFAAYAAGMLVVLTSLGIAAALAREGLARRLRRLLPFMNRFGGVTLIASGAYLTYYWLRLELGSPATLANDPVVGRVARYTGEIQSFASGDALGVVAAAAAVTAAAVSAAVWHARVRMRNP